MTTRLQFICYTLSILFLIGTLPGCPPPKPEHKRKPTLLLTNSKGEVTTTFDVLDVVFGSFSCLSPNKKYDIVIKRSNGSEVSRSTIVSNKHGIIPSTALWWDIGVEYSKSRVGRLRLDDVHKSRYICVLMQGKRRIGRLPFRIRSPEETGAFMFSSDSEGNPLNGFQHRDEDIYLTGKNFSPGSWIRIFITPDRYSWMEGDELSHRRFKMVSLRLDEGQRDFTKLIWNRTDTEIGAYDIIVEYKTKDNIYSRYLDLIDSYIGVGFTVFASQPPQPPPPVPHIESDLACQAPPVDPNTGHVIGAPNPIYKDYFSPDEDVWVAVNPYVGGHDFSNQNARLYVVHHKVETDWADGVALSDVSTDDYETVVVQPGCANINYHKVWSNPAIREEGYDVIVDFSPFGFYNRGGDIVDRLDDKGFVVPTDWICLQSVSLNHNSTSSNSDAINIRMNWTEDVVVPEWQKGKTSYPAAYIKSQIITVTAVFSAAQSVTSAKIRAGSAYGSLGTINETTVSFSNGSSGQVSFQVNGVTPNTIKMFYQKWMWYCRDVNGSGSSEALLGATKNKIFIVLAQPPLPWTTSGQTEPWTDVLTKSCWWANGETSIVGAAEQIAHHLFNDCGGTYVYGPGYTGKYAQNFRMTQFLNNYPSVGNVNCYDMGKSEVLFSNVLGCDLSYRLSQPFGSLNCEHAVGRPWKCTESFGNHGFGCRFVSSSCRIFDACLTIDTDAKPDESPYQETWMTDEPWSTYATKVVKTGNPGTPVEYSFSVE